MVDADLHQAENDRFYEEYEAGVMDIMEFLRFQLEPLQRIPMNVLYKLRSEFLDRYIEPIITHQARELVEQHRQRDAELMIITATNSFITRPIADKFGISHLIATEPEIIDGQYTGEVSGVPSYREGKVTRLNDWLAANGSDMKGSWFYSDSYNDLPLLSMVDHPVAVNPDERLRQHALDTGWEILVMNPAG
jgi:HAD superfamily hydrolase (TIGR01490 family)